MVLEHFRVQEHNYDMMKHIVKYIGPNPTQFMGMKLKPGDEIEVDNIDEWLVLNKSKTTQIEIYEYKPEPTMAIIDEQERKEHKRKVASRKRTPSIKKGKQ